MKISILTICYNAEAFIERAIQSVLQQNYDDWEHIIVDGGSTDGTVAILKKYQHLKWISEADKGQSDAMNKAFALSGGDVIGYLNSDDYYSLGVFSEVSKLFKSSEQPDIVVGKLKILMKDRVIYREPIKDYRFVSHFWLHKFPANPVSYFYKREIQTEVGEFPVDNHNTMDFWFLLRAFRNRRICKSDREFGVFDLHEDTKTFQGLSKNRLNDSLLSDYFEFAHILSLPNKIKFLYPWYKHTYGPVLQEQYNKYRLKFKLILSRL